MTSLFQLVKYQSLSLPWLFTISALQVKKETYMSHFKQVRFTIMLQTVKFQE